MTQFPDIRKEVVVPVSPEQAFAVFTKHPMEWWPPTHKLVQGERVAIVVDDAVGGRVYEIGADGSQGTWGKIFAYTADEHIAFTWRVNGRWQNIDNDEAASEIEVDFVAVDGGTKVKLAHVNLHKHGADAGFIHKALDGPSPGETLELFAHAVARLVPAA